MSRNNTGRLIVRLLVFAGALILVGADLVASAQNANSGTTQSEDASAQQMSNMNMNRGGGRRRRGRRRGGNMNAADTTTAETPVTAPVPTGRCDPMAQEQTDLSGTYTGRVGYTDVVMAGDGTLTINGNDFTLTAGPITSEGRIVAVTTCNYTAVTMRFGKDTPVAPGQTPPPPLPTVSLRARRVGGGLFLDTVPGESRQFSFHSTGAAGGGGVRRGTRGGMKRGAPPPVGIKPPTATGHDH